MLIPALVGQLHVPHARLQEPSRHQALPSKVVRDAFADSVQLERLLRFTGQVHQFGNRGLHAERQLVGFDHAIELRVGGGCAPRRHDSSTAAD